MDPIAASGSPFAALSLIVAPAIMTNASSVLAMSTSNRLARAVDRARELSRLLEKEQDLTGPRAAQWLREMSAAERRAVLLLRSLRSFYLALSGFATAALVSLLGAVLAPFGVRLAVVILEAGAICAGVTAVAALITGLLNLLRETRIAVAVLTERADRLRARAGTPADLARP